MTAEEHSQAFMSRVKDRILAKMINYNKEELSWEEMEAKAQVMAQEISAQMLNH